MTAPPKSFWFRRPTSKSISSQVPPSFLFSTKSIRRYFTVHVGLSSCCCTVRTGSVFCWIYLLNTSRNFFMCVKHSWSLDGLSLAEHLEQTGNLNKQAKSWLWWWRITCFFPSCFVVFSTTESWGGSLLWWITFHLLWKPPAVGNHGQSTLTQQLLLLPWKLLFLMQKHCGALLYGKFLPQLFSH